MAIWAPHHDTLNHWTRGVSDVAGFLLSAVLTVLGTCVHMCLCMYAFPLSVYVDAQSPPLPPISKSLTVCMYVCTCTDAHSPLPPPTCAKLEWRGLESEAVDLLEYTAKRQGVRGLFVKIAALLYEADGPAAQDIECLARLVKTIIYKFVKNISCLFIYPDPD